MTRLTGDRDRGRDIRTILMAHTALFLSVFSIVFSGLMYPFSFGYRDGMPGRMHMLLSEKLIPAGVFSVIIFDVQCFGAGF